MQVRKPILASLISLASFAPCKAQRAVQFAPETGICGVLNKETNFCAGMNFQLPKERNFTNLYTGISVQPDKKTSFVSFLVNNFSWTKNISSWARETFVASKNVANSTLDIAPIRANVNAGKFNFSLSPSYTLYNNFKDGTTTQGFSPIVQTTYTLSKKNKDQVFLEAKYSSEPSKNLFKTHFGKLKNNLSYLITYSRPL